MITDADIKGLPTPKPEEKVAGDPGGTITGNPADIPVGDAKKGLTVAGIAISNPDKELWPATKTQAAVTKADLVRYYEAAASRISTASRTARRAGSGHGTGSLKTTSMPSPVKRSSVPS